MRRSAPLTQKFAPQRDAAREDSEAKSRYLRRLEQLKHLQALQAKILYTMQSPSRFNPEAAEADCQDPSFYTLLKYYFDRIPVLRRYKPYRHFGGYSPAEVRQLLKFVQEFKQVQLELREWTFLPYTEHKGQASIPKELKCSFEAMNSERAKHFEASVKKEFVKQKVDLLQSLHEKSLRDHTKQVRDYVKDNPRAIGEERTRLMLQCPPHMLETIIAYSKTARPLMLAKYSPLTRKGRRARFDFRYWDQNDELPFSEVVADIAELQLDKRGHKPVLKMIGLDDKYAPITRLLESFAIDYHRMLRQALERLAAKKKLK